MTELSTPEPESLNMILSAKRLEPLTGHQAVQFQIYLELILKWNQRMNLTAIRDRTGILNRHFVECINCARALPAGIETALDFGSGAGLPGVPIAICRPEISVTLAESQTKKAAFLNEVVRALTLSARVFAGRAEKVGVKFDCVAMRAVDQMAKAVSYATDLVAQRGWLALMATVGTESEATASAGKEFRWEKGMPLTGSAEGILLLGRRD